MYAIINNYELGISKWREKGFLRIFNNLNLEDHVEFIDWTKFADLNVQEIENRYEKIILSGSSYNLSSPEIQLKMERLISLIPRLEIPILGICFGLHQIATAFGFCIVKMDPVNTEWDKIIKLEISKTSELFLPKSVYVEEKHHEKVNYEPELEKIFNITSSSQSCRIQIMEHKKRPVYGVQFHPESLKHKCKKDGYDIIKSFLA